MPQPNSFIKFPRKGRLQPRGYTEPVFEEKLKTYFLRQRNLELYNDRFLLNSNQTRPFETDFALIDERENFNLFIDIEIDEPYDLRSRVSTHCKGKDDYRNKKFNERGWIVIRFAEIQIHQNPMGCCRLIAEVIKSLNNNFTIPHDLINIPLVKNVPFWTKVQSEKWARENFRENYLGINIEVDYNNNTFIIDPDNLEQNESEKQAENNIIKTNEFQPENPCGRFNIENKNYRDDRLIFYPEPHIYLIDDNPQTISASTLVQRFFNDFDDLHWANHRAQQRGVTTETILQEWRNTNQEATNLGTKLHIDIQNYFEGITPKNPTKEFLHFLSFYNEHICTLKPYRTEWRIFDDVIFVAGTADMILKTNDVNDDKYVIYDWKRSQRIRTHNQFQKGFGPCIELDDCNFNHYCLQLNIYKKILSEYYAKDVSEMYLVQLHPNFDNYIKIEIPNMKDIVDEMFIQYANMNK